MSRALGLDFGTTNTVMFKSAAKGRAEAVSIPVGGEELQALRSALCFWQGDGVPPPTLAEAGPFAISRFLDDPDECRFLQSMKTFAASPLFQGTDIFARRYQFEDLLTTYVSRLRGYAGAQLEALPKRLVVGRPVEFAGASADAELAMQRYDLALQRFGFEEILYVYEPVAAAFFYAQGLSRSTTILVADLGGGTSDFSIMHFHAESEGDGFRAEPLAQGGVGIAGDHFDYRIIDHVILPHLGKGSQFRSFDKLLELPKSYFTSFARWNQLSVLKGSEDFRQMKLLVRDCLEPKKIRRYIDLVEAEQGYALYEAVSRAKTQLSSTDAVELTFAPLGRDFSATIRRSDFDGWIAQDLGRIEEALDETLAKAGLAVGEIDKVFLTGGTSFVPAVRQLLARRFGPDSDGNSRIESGDELVSIANGLAVIGAREDAAEWAIDVRAGEAQMQE